MRKNVEEFFLGLKDANFLAMKLLLGVFEKMEKSDSMSRRIVDNISILSQYNLLFTYSGDSGSYVYSEDDLSKIEYAIASCGSEYVACHEFGHLLLDLVARGEVPEDFKEINSICQKRLLDNKEYVSSLLQKYRDFAFEKLIEEIDDPLKFYERHPELKDEYFEKNPDADEDEMMQDIIVDHFALISAFDKNICDYNKVSNIIDGIFHGNNPFFLDYGNEHFDPVLAMHTDEYYETGDFGPLVMGFEEQFADYLVLRVYHDEMIGTINTLHGLIGSEWFSMMDKFYDKVTNRISDKGKVYQYK